MKRIYLSYLESFKHLSTEIWYLALISLINRAGTMVIPFLSLYLKNDLGFNKDAIGWVFVCFGVGSVMGSWLGGKLTDRLGFYKVMVLSLFITGINFIALQFLSTFWGLCIGILVTMTIADSFRPAVMVAIKAYSKPENQTRSIGLIRLAINAGMGISPTVAGLVIVLQGYKLLFWIDGLTCMVAIALFYKLVKSPGPRKANTGDSEVQGTPRKVYTDMTFWIHSIICFLFGMAFFQLLFALPLYYNEIFNLNEFKIGMLLFINVAIIVVFEMPLLNLLEKKLIPVTRHIFNACLLLLLSFLILYQNYWVGILVISMILLTLSEMLGFPYTNKFVLNRATEGQEGSYMAMYTMSFSLAHIFSPKFGMGIIDSYGYQINWLITGGYAFLGLVLAHWLHLRVKQKR